MRGAWTLKISHLKLLDKTVGCFLIRCLPSVLPAPAPFAQGRILLIRPGGIGDAVLLAPAIRSLRNTFPSLQITVLAERRNAGVFPLVPGVDALLCYDRPRELLQALRSNFDAVIDSEQSHRLSALVARFVPAAVKIGFDTNDRRRMFTHPVPYSHDDYERVSFARLLVPLGIGAETVESEAPFLSLPLDASGKAAVFLEPLHGEPFVAVFPGASIPERRWGADRFRRVAELLSVFGIRVVIVGGKEDHQQGELIAGGGLGINLAGLTSLAETGSIVPRDSLAQSGDSGVLHIAVGLGVPTVSLFGPGRAKKWAPQGEQHIVINKGLACSPCTTFGTTPPCPVDARCMRDITVDEVANAVSMLLTSLGAMPSRCCKRDWIETKKNK